MKTIFSSLQARLLLGYAIPLILFLGAALVAYVTIQRLLVSLENEKKTEEVLAKVFQVKESIASMAAAERAHHLVSDGKAALKERFEQEHREVCADLEQLLDLVHHDPKRRTEVEAVQDLEQRWFQFAQQDFTLQATPILNWQDFIKKIHTQKGLGLIDAIRHRMNGIVEAESAVLEQRRQTVQTTTRESVWAIGLAVSVSVVLSVVIALLVAQGILQPVRQLQSAFGKLRQGKFEAVHPYGPAEISELMRGYNLAGIALAERTTLLESSERRYRTIVGTTTSLLWAADASGRNTEMSSWRGYTGQTEEQTTNEGWLEAVHPEDRAALLRRWEEALARKIYVEDEIRIRGVSGEYRHFCCRSVPIFDPSGAVIEWVRICDDITKQKQEQSLRRDKEAAEAANRAKSEFLAKMSHELRTPLNAVIGMSKMLSTQRFGILNAKQLDYLTDITQAGEHLLALINDILDLSKVEAGRMDLVPEPMSVHTTVGLIFSTLKALGEDKKLQMELDLAQPDRTIVADLARFKQILFNLLSNAVKFTPEGGRVAVRGRWAADVRVDPSPVEPTRARALRLDVEDSGIGISPADQARIGNEFFQANRSASQTREGTGLGLALTQRLVDLMGGVFWFTSTLGQGSCFSVVLPLFPGISPGPEEVRGQTVPRTHPAAAGREPACGRPLALIIDDHEPTNKLLADWLREVGLEVASAFDGREGLEKVKTLQPQLVLLDIRLPRLNGLQVLSRLKSNPVTAGIPIVVVSSMEGFEHLNELDIVDWFVKPLDKERFLKKLQGAFPNLFDSGNAITVLLVDSDRQVRQRFSEMLAGEKVRVLEAEDEDDVLQEMEQYCPDVVILDLDLPRLNSIRLVETIRGQPRWAHVPIILTLEQMTSEEVQPLGGTIQGILRKETLTKDKFLDRLRKIGVDLPLSN